MRLIKIMIELLSLPDTTSQEAPLPKTFQTMSPNLLINASCFSVCLFSLLAMSQLAQPSSSRGSSVDCKVRNCIVPPTPALLSVVGMGVSESAYVSLRAVPSSCWVVYSICWNQDFCGLETQHPFPSLLYPRYQRSPPKWTCAFSASEFRSLPYPLSWSNKLLLILQNPVQANSFLSSGEEHGPWSQVLRFVPSSVSNLLCVLGQFALLLCASVSLLKTGMMIIVFLLW